MGTRVQASLRFLLLALLALAGGCAAAAEAQVLLRALARVQDGTVLLSDVATITGQDKVLVQRLSDIPLGQSPRAGESARLDRQSVEKWVRRQLGDAAQAVQWTGAEAVRLTTRRTEPSSRSAAAPRSAALAVTRGEWATLRARSGPIELERRVEVLEDGAIGQAVRVRWAGAGTSDTLEARVVAAGYLEVEP